LPEVSVEESFFALGGDSILVIQVVVRCRRVGLELTPLQVFQGRTIAALAAQLVAAGISPPSAGVADTATTAEPAPSAAFAEAGLSEDDLDSFLAGLEEEETFA
jgi:aryl carrier-like protein